MSPTVELRANRFKDLGVDEEKDVDGEVTSLSYLFLELVLFELLVMYREEEGVV